MALHPLRWSASRSAALILLAAPLLPAQAGIGRRAELSPFVPVGGGEGVLQVAWDAAGTYGLFAGAWEAGGLLELQGFALPGDRSVDLLLRPVRVMAPGALAVIMEADGSHELLPRVVMFTGSMPDGSGEAFLAVAPEMVNGWVRLSGELLFLSSAGSPDTAVVASAAAFPPFSAGTAWCQALQPALRAPSQGGRQNGTAGLVLKTADVFVECDDGYRSLWGSDAAAADYAVTLFGALGTIYRRDLGVVVSIPNNYLRIWNTTPPWGPGQSVVAIRDWWSSPQNPDQGLPRAAVHVLSNPVFGGVAYLPGVCDNDWGYALSGVSGFFPNPIRHTDPGNWDLMVVCHETGHNFGSPHTFNYSPPIDCYDGSGPDDGTLMSYCHLEPGGMGQMGMRFHQRVQEMILGYIGGLGCFGSLPIQAGDYDADGLLTAADLAMFDQCQAQGFFSTGCLQTFDMDGDGALTACDRTILLSRVQGFDLVFDHDPLVRGASAQLRASGALAGESVYFLYSLAGEGCGPCPAKLGGLCLDLRTPVKVAGQAAADASGNAALAVPVPAGAPALLEVSFQAVVRRGPGGADSVKSPAATAPLL